MQYSTITKSNIGEIIEFVKSNNFSCKLFLQDYNSNYETQILGPNKKKFIIRSISDSINTVIVDCEMDTIYNIAFYGQMALSNSDLKSLFGVSKTSYNSRDDITFYYFEIDNLIISYFSDGSDYDLNNQLLDNLFINFSNKEIVNE